MAASRICRQFHPRVCFKYSVERQKKCPCKCCPWHNTTPRNRKTVWWSYLVRGDATQYTYMNGITASLSAVIMGDTWSQFRVNLYSTNFFWDFTLIAFWLPFVGVCAFISMSQCAQASPSNGWNPYTSRLHRGKLTTDMQHRLLWTVTFPVQPMLVCPSKLRWGTNLYTRAE